ncbi:MAG TPA: bifunctional UDP-N-acetylglucosamine diphosphorylase/glucosamine-1-phosphate N-acetyltransferase GlmU [Myxococcota bacterium]|jgi:bifunctional UDP-N-acetylglucosamine pyrophosphorylase/glucosamine-1-phosphate N-acetyltransferase
MGATPREIAALLLAAGQGTRMKSALAKVLHPIAGRPMLHYPLAAAEALHPRRLIVVVGRDAEQVGAAVGDRAELVLQSQQRGTGHAVLQTARTLEGFRGDVLILYGDTPLLRAETLQRMLRHKAETGADLVMLSAQVAVPGIVVRDASGRVARIVEATDASPAELAIEERNTGVYLLGAELLWKMLAQVGDQNRQGEIYLTSIVEIAVSEGFRVEALRIPDGEEAIGVNQRAELARAAAVVRARKLNQLMLDGVSIVDPAATWIDVDVEVGRDAVIEPGCVIQGATRIGERVHLKPGCMIESSEIGDDAVIGPNAHLRPGTRLGRGVRIGNFVEVKNSVLGEGVKADHLSYIGDADVGEGASFGCGSVVVNYDGIAKHRTRVGPRAFIGCNANLVAPLRIAEDAFVAAGSTITKDVPALALGVAREKQKNIEGWVARRRASARPKPEPAHSKPGKSKPDQKGKRKKRSR